MSAHYESPNFARVFEQEMQVIGADVFTGMLLLRAGKALKDLHILDAGCGPGRYSKALVDFGIGKISLMDASGDILKCARQNLKDAIDNGIIVDITEAKLPSLPYKDGTFDAVLFNYVLQDLEMPENRKTFSAIETALHNAKRVLKTNGFVFITTSQPEMFTESMWYTKANPPMAKKLSSFFPTNKDWANAFAECGFEIVSALNSLVPDMKHHFDPEGPFREQWRLGSCAFLCYSDEEERAALKPFIDLKEKGLLEKFIEDNDRTAIIGMSTIYILRSAN